MYTNQPPLTASALLVGDVQRLKMFAGEFEGHESLLEIFNESLDHPLQNILICADNDGVDASSNKSIDNAVNALLKEGKTVKVVQPEMLKQDGKTDKTDFNDVLKIQGADDVRAQINKAMTIDRPSKVIDLANQLRESINHLAQVKDKNNAPSSAAIQDELGKEVKKMDQANAQLQQQQRVDLMNRIDTIKRQNEALKSAIKVSGERKNIEMPRSDFTKQDLDAAYKFYNKQEQITNDFMSDNRSSIEAYFKEKAAINSSEINKTHVENQQHKAPISQQKTPQIEKRLDMEIGG